jgi:glucose/arabinose dehydrogenase
MSNRTRRTISTLGLSILVSACAALPGGQELVPRPQGSFPKENPQIPMPDAKAAVVPSGYKVEVAVKDLIYPTSVEFDDQGNMYIAEAGYAYGDPVAPGRVLRISKNGAMKYVAEQLTGPITDLLWHQGRLYISHFRKISALGADGKVVDLVTDLPSTGEHQNNMMTIGPDGKIYFGQGTATNSGVVGLDSMIPFLWLAYWPDLHDVPAKDVKLRGESFVTPQPNNVMAKQSILVTLPSNIAQIMSSMFNISGPGSLLARTGAFQPFGTSGAGTVAGQTKANGTVLRMNPDGSGLEVYAWGLRNPFGVLWGPDGRLYASENAYDERGSRPIANALDNVWVIKQDSWYGWPDFSSGIPVTDPRFKSVRGRAPEFLMAEHPPVEKPLFTRPKHAGLTKMDFSKNERFGFAGDMFLGEFGAGAPITAAGEVSAGHQVVRVNMKTGKMEPFFRANDSALAQGAMKYVTTPAPKHPVDVRFSPAGDAMYVVDIGALFGAPAGAGPMAKSIPGSGVVWRISREGIAVDGPPANLSPLPGR